MRPRKASGSTWGRLGRSWEALGLSEGLLGGSWGSLEAILGPLGRVLGASWGDLGASWEGLGAFGGGLGASWNGLLGACWHKVIFDRFLDGFWTDSGAQMDPQRSPKWSSKPTKIEHKNNDKI